MRQSIRLKEDIPFKPIDIHPSLQLAIVDKLGKATGSVDLVIAEYAA